MGLYLCIYDANDDEVDGVEVGSYADFGAFRDAVARHLENDQFGARFPVLMLHSDCDGSWSPEEAAKLEAELGAIGAAFDALPAAPFFADWQKDVAKLLGLRPRTLKDSFIDVDGEPLVDRLVQLCRKSQESLLSIVFQ
jgi:hypothetical protein